MAAENEPPVDAEQPTEARSGLNVMGLIKIAAFLVVVVTVECLVAVFVFPSAAETQQRADAMLGQGASGDMLPVEPLEMLDSNDEPDKIEVDLGEFRVASYQPTLSSTLQIDFHLYATVLTDQEATFKDLMEEKEQRVRDQVLTIVRSANTSDLHEAGLRLFKRKILDTVNRTLGKPVLVDVIFGDFSWEER